MICCLAGHFFLFPDGLSLKENSRDMKKVAVHLAEGFEEIEAITIIDVLRRADLDVTVVSVTGHELVSGAHQLQVKTDVLFESLNYNLVDMIVLPGGMPGADNLNSHEGLRKNILKFNQEGKPLGAICAAPLVFGQLGLLKGKRAVCYPGFENQLEGAEVMMEPVVKSGNITTGRGIGAALQFSLQLVEDLISKEKAQDLAKQMLTTY